MSERTLRASGIRPPSALSDYFRLDLRPLTLQLSEAICAKYMCLFPPNAPRPQVTLYFPVKLLYEDLPNALKSHGSLARHIQIHRSAARPSHAILRLHGEAPGRCPGPKRSLSHQELVRRAARHASERKGNRVRALGGGAIGSAGSEVSYGRDYQRSDGGARARVRESIAVDRNAFRPNLLKFAPPGAAASIGESADALVARCTGRKLREESIRRRFSPDCAEAFIRVRGLLTSNVARDGHALCRPRRPKSAFLKISQNQSRAPFQSSSASEATPSKLNSEDAAAARIRETFTSFSIDLSGAFQTRAPPRLNPAGFVLLENMSDLIALRAQI
ncbi:hypothetical protein FB451DRAFT_1190088 [Mycena latifolia]|nr:hypothetical protein FB451DRAFT_1190088 [Mycena latifolia]